MNSARGAGLEKKKERKKSKKKAKKATYSKCKHKRPYPIGALMLNF